MGEVPAGSVRTKVFYTGLPTQEKIVVVTAGGRTEENFSLGRDSRSDPNATVQLDAFVVESTRDMTSASITINEQLFRARWTARNRRQQRGAMAR